MEAINVLYNTSAVYWGFIFPQKQNNNKPQNCKIKIGKMAQKKKAQNQHRSKISSTPDWEIHHKCRDAPCRTGGRTTFYRGDWFCVFVCTFSPETVCLVMSWGKKKKVTLRTREGLQHLDPVSFCCMVLRNRLLAVGRLFHAFYTFLLFSCNNIIKQLDFNCTTRIFHIKILESHALEKHDNGGS